MHCIISFNVSVYVLQLLHSVIGENRRGTASADLCVHFVGGGLAGITAASSTYPLDLVRTRLAAQVMSAYMGDISQPVSACASLI